MNTEHVSRRSFLRTSATFGLLAGMEQFFPSYAAQALPHNEHNADGKPAPIDLEISEQKLSVGDRHGKATLINGTLPGPLLRWREGDEALIRVTNHLAEDTSIHWHGILLPSAMDGVPGVTFDGIKPKTTFTYRFPLRQSGTYWYHSHSAFQEQSGVYGPLIIDPADPEPFKYDREYVVVLSDWTPENPFRILANLKKESGYYNFQRRTMGDFFRDVSQKGLKATFADRLMWSRMRMDPTDISDITAYTYTYLINGLPPGANWSALFKPGERVLLRFINASAATYFDVRLPGLPMTVVQADGQNVQPVTVDEFRIAIAETYDVIVEPKEDRAYTLFAETMDRSGYARGTLAPRQGMSAEIPERRNRPLLTMADMGMAEMAGHSAQSHGSAPQSKSDAGNLHAGHSAAPQPAAADPHAGHGKSMEMDSGGSASNGYTRHTPDTHGPGNASVAQLSKSRLDEPGVGLEDAPWRVLVYNDLRRLEPDPEPPEPEREIELHLTGNMEKYIWGIDGKKFSEAPEPIAFRFGERLRLTLVNDTMMNHPMHLHGMWMYLENGSGAHKPRKHTINIKPAERVSLDITADAPGFWAFHCHILYHMEMGMFRIVSVSGQKGGRS